MKLDKKRKREKDIYQLKNEYLTKKKELIDEFVNCSNAFTEAGLSFQDVIDRYNQLRKSQQSQIINCK